MRAAPQLGGAEFRTRWDRARQRTVPTAVASALALMVIAFAGTPAAIASARRHHASSVVAVAKYNVVTRVVIAQSTKPIYHAPNTRSGVVRDLWSYTPDNEALQTYQLLGLKRVRRTLWAHIAVPMRPNGITGWVKRGWLGSAIVSHTLVLIDRAAHRLTVYQRGVPVFSAPVGVGRATMPTPPGHFWIAEGFSSDDPAYGPWAFGTSDYATEAAVQDGFELGGGIVGVHGTNEPRLIPGNPSHGCIRLRDQNIVKLRRFVDIGAGLWVE